MAMVDGEYQQPAVMTLRDAMECREGAMATADAIRRGLRAFAVERWTGTPGYRRRQTAIVFGRAPSDALRRASAPGRLCEEIHGDVTHTAPIASGWDEPIAWPDLPGDKP